MIITLHWLWEEKHFYLLFKNWKVLICKRLNYFIKECFMPSLVEIGPVILENLNPLHQRMLCAKFCWNWLSGSIKRRFLNLANIFSLFLNYLPLEKVEALYLNKFESPSLKDPLYKIWMLFALWFWRRRFLNFINAFSVFRNYLPLEKVEALHLNKPEFFLPKDVFFTKFGWN